jgi:uncharacterized protein YndB with AHSA1/START domain
VSEKVLVVKRTLPANPAVVFDALTQPAIMARWFFAGPDWNARVEGEPRVGGRYSIEMVMPDGNVAKMWGQYNELDPPTRVVFTWNTDRVSNTVVTIELTARGTDETELVLYHLLPEEAEVQRMHQAGWLACLENLAGVLAGGQWSGHSLR